MFLVLRRSTFSQRLFSLVGLFLILVWDLTARQTVMEFLRAAYTWVRGITVLKTQAITLLREGT